MIESVVSWWGCLNDAGMVVVVAVIITTIGIFANTIINKYFPQFTQPWWEDIDPQGALSKIACGFLTGVIWGFLLSVATGVLWIIILGIYDTIKCIICPGC